MATINPSFYEKLIKAGINKIREEGVDKECPHCGKPLKIYEVDSKCPECGGDIHISFEFDTKSIESLF